MTNLGSGSNRILVKLHWLDRAVETAKFHLQQCKDERGWTIEKTAKILNRSVGAVSNDITLASWVVTHEKQLRRMRSMRDAMDYINQRKKEMTERINDI